MIKINRNYRVSSKVKLFHVDHIDAIHEISDENEEWRVHFEHGCRRKSFKVEWMDHLCFNSSAEALINPSISTTKNRRAK